MSEADGDTGLEDVQFEIARAYSQARQKHAPMHSPHEGYAVLLEEVDELWAEVKRWQPENYYADAEDGELRLCEARAAMRQEAVHVAAMALAFLLEVCE